MPDDDPAPSTPASSTPAPSTPAADPAALDPAAILRSRDFVKLLVLSALVGILVSVVGWGFLELVHQIQIGVFQDLPQELGFTGVPEWWYLVWLGLAGVVTAFAIVKLPGKGGHVPAHGLQVGGNEPNFVFGIALAAVASLGLGAVLGPEAPLIAIGSGVAVAFVKALRKDSPAQLLMIIGAAGSFAAISVIFGSPIVAAILVVEATGLGGPMLPLVLIPGLVSAGIGSLVFIGMANFTGLDTSAYSLVPLHLPHFSGVTWEEIGWTIALGLAGAVITQVVRRVGLAGAALALRKPWVVIPVAGLVTAGLAILFQQTTDHGASAVLFSGQEALPGLVNGAAGWSVGALAMVMVCKGLAWGACLGTFRGGPTFPAIFLGAAGGILASHLPGLPLAPAVAVGMGIMVVAFLKLPLSAVVIATALTATGGLSLGPLIIIGVVVAYIATLGLEGRLGGGGPLARIAARSPAA